MSGSGQLYNSASRYAISRGCSLFVVLVCQRRFSVDALNLVVAKLNLFRLVKPDQNMFAKEIEIDVKFPFTVEKKHVDILIKSDDPMSQSLLAMYV